MPDDVSLNSEEHFLDPQNGFPFDFQRIVNQKAILRVLANYTLDLSTFDRKQNPNLSERLGRFVGLYQRESDHFEITVKEFPRFGSAKDDALLCLLEMLTHLKHPSIAPLFGIVLPTDSTSLKIATLCCQSVSLNEVLANPPSWWTPTAKSKTIAGIALGMRFAHSLDCAHGSLKPSNILFDSNQNVQIVDFCSNLLRESVSNDGEVSARCEAEDEAEALQTDVLSFSSILFEILVGRSIVVETTWTGDVEIRFVDDGERAAIPSFIPFFVRQLMEKVWSDDWWTRPSFSAIYEYLKQNNFDVVKGNDVTEVLRFVSSLEASECEGE
jgi:serine/threonine protein kinase